MQEKSTVKPNKRTETARIKIYPSCLNSSNNANSPKPKTKPSLEPESAVSAY